MLKINFFKKKFYFNVFSSKKIFLKTIGHRIIILNLNKKWCG